MEIFKQVRRIPEFDSIPGCYVTVPKELTAVSGCAINSRAGMFNEKEHQGYKCSVTVNGVICDNGGLGSPSKFEVGPPKAEIGKVRLRVVPSPTGFLHIGHAKAVLLIQYFVKSNQGQLILRFNDTNPAKESNEFIENILKDIETLGIVCDAVTFTSDYFQKLMKKAEDLIWEGKAYVDDTQHEEMQKEKMDAIESRCRNNSLQKNFELWREMIAGSERGLQCCLRGKLNMTDPNKALRDPVYYRCNPVTHHRSGSKYKLYPTFDFACPFVDAEEGITHVLRASEYHDHNALYHRIQEDMGVRKVHMYESGKLNMGHTFVTRRNLLWLVQNGKVDGWDDPRLPTVQGLVRRGLKIEALIQFVVEQGPYMKLDSMEWDKLWTINRRIVNPVCPVHTAVIGGRMLLTLTNGPKKPSVGILPRCKRYAGAGKKRITFTKTIRIDHADAARISEGDEITLMDWGNAVVKDIVKDEGGNVTHATGCLVPEVEGPTRKLPKLTWLPETGDLVNLLLVEFDDLTAKKEVKEGGGFIYVFNPCTKRVSAAVGDSNMRDLKRGEILQLEWRKGYFRCDVPFTSPSEPIVLFAIPDGQQVLK